MYWTTFKDRGYNAVNEICSEISDIASIAADNMAKDVDIRTEIHRAK